MLPRASYLYDCIQIPVDCEEASSTNRQGKVLLSLLFLLPGHTIIKPNLQITGLSIYILPNQYNTATEIKMGEHSFMGIIDVREPVNNETPAMTTNMTPNILYTSIDEWFSIPSNTIMRITNNPIKDSARPSIIHYLLHDI